MVSQEPWPAAAALLNIGRSVAFYGRQAFGARGVPARLVLFSGAAAGMASEVCQRLNRPEATMPLVLTPRRQAAEVFRPPYADRLPDSLAQAVAAPLAARWRARLPAAMAPDFLCRPYPVDPDLEPQFSDLLEAYAAQSGLPALLGLPIQVGRSAPLDAPADALRLLAENRVDYIVTEHAVWERGE
jgi:carbamoyltransferase